MGSGKNYHFPFMWVQKGTVVKQLSIDHLHRREKANPVDTIRIDQGAIVENLSIRDLTLVNETDSPCVKFNNCGLIRLLRAEGLSEDEIINSGDI